MSETGATRTLATFVATTDSADLPTGMRDLLRSYVLDALAAGVVGRDQPWTAMVRELAQRRGGAEEASVFGATRRLPAPAAAWTNGVAIGAFELDHGAHLAHPASTVLPAALAAAELRQASGADFLLALALGYETACRVGAAQTRAVEDHRGFHNPGANGPFGAAAAAGRLWGLDADEQASAFGVAGSSAAGTVEYLSHGSMTKKLHLGAAARAGLEAVQLAAAGFTGPPTILEGRRGFLHAFSPAPRPAALTADLGEEWLATTLRIKPYPCHGALQGLVSALQRFRSDHPEAASAADRVHIVAGRQDRILQERFLRREPRSLIEAQCSTPVAVAVALSRDLRDPREFGAGVWDDAQVGRIAGAVTWELTAAPATPGVHVLVECAGRLHRVEVSGVGGPAAPATWPAVVDKFQRHTAHRFSPVDQDRVIDLVAQLDTLPGVDALVDWVRR